MVILPLAVVLILLLVLLVVVVITLVFLLVLAWVSTTCLFSFEAGIILSIFKLLKVLVPGVSDMLFRVVLVFLLCRSIVGLFAFRY